MEGPLWEHVKCPAGRWPGVCGAYLPLGLAYLRTQLYKPELKFIKRLVGHQLIQQNRRVAKPQASMTKAAFGAVLNSSTCHMRQAYVG